jgi:hypothetical protein
MSNPVIQQQNMVLQDLTAQEEQEADKLPNPKK